MTWLRVAVTGGNGVLGTALRDVRPRWNYLGRDDCDIRNGIGVLQVFDECRPHFVLHTAALTDHQHPNAADVIETNIIGTGYVVQACRELNIPIVYTSTHYVYEGVRGAYSENDFAKPIGAYAQSKLAGEQWVGTTLPETSLVVRGSWYTRETRLDHWARRGALVDAWCSREPVADAARKIVALVEAGVRGVVNIGGPRRSFAQILRDEGYSGFPVLERQRFDSALEARAPYPFPADTSVSTVKFDGLGLDWRGVTESVA